MRENSLRSLKPFTEKFVEKLKPSELILMILNYLIILFIKFIHFPIIKAQLFKYFTLKLFCNQIGKRVIHKINKFMNVKISTMFILFIYTELSIKSLIKSSSLILHTQVHLNRSHINIFTHFQETSWVSMLESFFNFGVGETGHFELEI